MVIIVRPVLAVGWISHTRQKNRNLSWWIADLAISDDGLADHGPNNKKRHADGGVNDMHWHKGTLGSCYAKRLRASSAVRQDVFG
jgi:hypothetical protein